jgi:CDP-glucose 4,6-dehydratase
VRILVTGHTGFVGSWLAFLLSQSGHTVFGLSNKIRKSSIYFHLKSQNYNLIEDVVCDIRNKEQLCKEILRIKPDLVFHLAAQPFVKRASVQPEETIESNLNGTLNLLVACEAVPSIQGIVIATSDKVYKSSKLDIRFTEESELGSIEPYGASKVMAELAVSAWRTVKFDSFPPIGVARSGNILGGGDDGENRLVPYLNDCIASNSDIYLRHPNFTRPWSYILDILNGYALLAEKLLSSRIFEGSWNFGPSTLQPLTVKEIAEIYLEIRKKPNIQINLSEENFYEQTYLSLDSTKSTNLLRWEPIFNTKKMLTEISKWELNKQNLRETSSCMKETINFFKNEIDLNKSNLSGLLYND